ncbi:MAG: VWA domain-containing protein, partial [Candidatus Eremiobacterota bacterium]
ANIACQAQGGHIVSFSSQKNFYDNAVFNLIDGDIWEKSWQSGENAPFPHEVVIALPASNIQKIDQVIIYNSLQSDNSAVKDIEIFVSADKSDKFVSMGTLRCKQTSAPQVLNFKKEVSAKLVKIRIGSNWGNPAVTSMKEIEISGPETQSLEINPLKGNLMSETSGARPVSYARNKEVIEHLVFREKIAAIDSTAVFQINPENLPVEITFNLPESKTYIVDNLRLHFFPSENRTGPNMTEVREFEILLSPDSPVDGFISMGRYLCSAGKADQSFSFLPQKAKYIKIKFMSGIDKDKTVVIQDMELYQPVVKRNEVQEEEKYQSGLKGFYFSGKNYRDFFREKVDFNIDFNWGIKSPITGMGSKDYCIYWDGKLYIPENGYYELGVKAVNGFQLYIDNQCVMQKWNRADSTSDQWIINKFRLVKGGYNIKLNYYHKQGDQGLLTLAWKKPGDSDLQVIDRKYLGHKITETKEIKTPRQAVQLGLDWLGDDILEWQDENKCYSCHAQPHVIMGFAAGDKNEYKYNTKATMSVMDLLKSGINKDGSLAFPQAESLTALQFVAIAMANYNKYIGDEGGDEFIRISNFLVAKQMPAGNWKNDNSEPPVQQGDIMCTTNALLTLLQTYKKTGDESFSPSIQKASAWLEKAVPVTTQDMAFQIIGLSSYPSPDAKRIIENDINKLYTMQNEDGGWGEGENTKSNCFSTGQVVYALKLAGVKLSITNFSTGIQYLIQNQNVFGSWPLENTQSRRPSEIGSTVWAIMALANTFESLVINIINPEQEQTFAPKDVNEDYPVETKIYSSSSSKIKHVEFFIDGKSIGIVENSPYKINWKPLGYSGGKHNIMVIARDTEGKEASDVKTIFLDKALKIEITSPQEGNISEPQVGIKVKIENKINSPVTKVEYYLDDKLIQEATKEPYDITWNTIGVANGRHTLKARVFNKIGDTSTSEKIIMVNRKLEISLKKPLQGMIVNDKIEFSSNILNNSGSPVTRVDYYLGEKLLGYSKDGKSYNYTWPVKGVKDGDYTVKAVVHNELGENASAESNISIALSLQISLQNIREGDVLTGKKALNCRIINKSKIPLSNVIYYLDGRTIGKSVKPPYKIVWDTGEYASGDYILKVVANSTTGAKSHSQVKIKIEHPIINSFYATILNEEGKYVPKINKDNFIVEEDGVQQNSFNVNICNDGTPTSYGVMIDTGQKMSDYFQGITPSIQKFLDSIKPGSDSSVVVFADSVLKKVDISSNKKDVRKILSAVKPSGGSAIYDSAMETIRILKKSEKRKVIILFTANIDENIGGTGPASKYKLEDVLREASKSNCIIYIVAIGPWADEYLLIDLSNGTGGRFYAAPDTKSIDDLIKIIAFDLTYMYNITYKSLNLKRDGKWREVNVMIKEQPAYIINFRKGYYGPRY